MPITFKTTQPILTRRVDLVAQLHHSVDRNDAIRRLQTRIRQIPNVLTQPAPDIEILKLDAAGPVLAVRPYCHNDNYWQVYFDTNKIIRETFTDAGYPVPEEHFLFTGLSKATANGN